MKALLLSAWSIRNPFFFWGESQVHSLVAPEARKTPLAVPPPSVRAAWPMSRLSAQSAEARPLALFRHSLSRTVSGLRLSR